MKKLESFEMNKAATKYYLVKCLDIYFSNYISWSHLYAQLYLVEFPNIKNKNTEFKYNFYTNNYAFKNNNLFVIIIMMTFGKLSLPRILRGVPCHLNMPTSIR